MSLTGRLTKDPELRYTPSGVPMARFTLAVNRTFSGQNGEREADFITCLAWRKQAENLANYMRKGNLIGVTGRIQTGSFEGQDGKRVYTTDVIAENIAFLESSRGNENAPASNNNTYQQPPQNTQGQYQQPPSNTQGQYGSTPQYQDSQPQYRQQSFDRQNYSKLDEDPFANSKGPIEVSEDDLPF